MAALRFKKPTDSCIRCGASLWHASFHAWGLALSRRSPRSLVQQATLLARQLSTRNRANESFRVRCLPGGPVFRFNEAISLQVHCETQEEVNHYWEKLSEGGDEKAQQCGWLKDKFGVSWQVVPSILIAMLNDHDPAKSQRTMQAVLQMKRIDIDKLKRAYAD
jgi:hypothetical protein